MPSYHIATINIEETFKKVSNLNKYIPFKGIVLTDTFESTKHENTLDDLFGDNDKRLKRQEESPITVIMDKIPYYAKKTSDSDNNRNISYPKLDNRINETYGRLSNAQNKAN
ncbi:hypothetical protein [Paraliobacillus sp. JSM ZJ581]|uniref:hypothetical protein n=1 Tax=Paraliobacillus sp. JSM ZJ581 TaxID=3342118 RepID=UPI0035A8676F